MKANSESTVLITGVTGFLGSHIGAALVDAGYRVVALKRSTSSLRRCASYSEKVQWVDHDCGDWARLVVSLAPNVVVHCAWGGVSASERNDWKLQFANLVFLSELLETVGKTNVEQIVAFGSQAEYGSFTGRVDELHAALPVSAYGSTKLAALALLEGYSRQHAISYAWLRLFSLYGPAEDERWLIPGLIRQFSESKVPQLTPCEQRYDYMHVSDLSRGALAVLQRPERSGVFNFSSNESVQLKQVVKLIQRFAGSKLEPAFGALAYRPGQSMHVEGNSERFFQTFEFQPAIALEEGLRALVEESLSRA